MIMWLLWSWVLWMRKQVPPYFQNCQSTSSPASTGSWFLAVELGWTSESRLTPLETSWRTKWKVWQLKKKAHIFSSELAETKRKIFSVNRERVNDVSESKLPLFVVFSCKKERYDTTAHGNSVTPDSNQQKCRVRFVRELSSPLSGGVSSLSGLRPRDVVSASPNSPVRNAIDFPIAGWSAPDFPATLNHSSIKLLITVAPFSHNMTVLYITITVLRGHTHTHTHTHTHNTNGIQFNSVYLYRPFSQITNLSQSASQSVHIDIPVPKPDIGLRKTPKTTLHREKREEPFRRATEEDPSPGWTGVIYVMWPEGIIIHKLKHSNNTINEYDRVYE